MIDKVIVKHDAINQSCTIGIKDRSHAQGKLPYVYAVLNNQYNELVEDIRKQILDLCKKELPEYAQPVDIKFLDELPLTPIGKVDYRELEKFAMKDITI